MRFHKEPKLQKKIRIFFEVLEIQGIEVVKPLVSRKTAHQIVLIAIKKNGVVSLLRLTYSS